MSETTALLQPTKEEKPTKKHHKEKKEKEKEKGHHHHKHHESGHSAAEKTTKKKKETIEVCSTTSVVPSAIPISTIAHFEGEKGAGIDSLLSDALIAMIIGKLPVQERIKASIVSKRWNKIVFSSPAIVWRSLLFSNTPSRVISKMSTTKAITGSVTEIQCFSPCRITEKELQLFIPCFSGALTSLNFHGCSILNDKTLSLILSGVPNLRSLDISLTRCGGGASSAKAETNDFAKTFPKTLTYFNAEMCDKLGNSSLLSICAHCPNIEYLNLTNTRVGDASLRSLSNSTELSSKLRVLKLCNCKWLSSTSIVELSKLSNLEFLDISGTSTDDDAIQRFLSSSSSSSSCSLKVLKMAHCRNISALVFDNLNNLKLLKMELLDLNATSIKDSTAPKMVDLCPNLKFLCLSWTNLSDVGVTSFVSSLKYLSFLDLSWTRVSEAAVRKVLKEIQNLHHIGLEGCEHVSSSFRSSLV